MREVSVIVYRYEELGKAAQQRALDTWREFVEPDMWADDVIAAFTRIIHCYGFSDVDVRYNVSFCQSDGAFFTSSWSGDAHVPASPEILAGMYLWPSHVEFFQSLKEIEEASATLTRDTSYRNTGPRAVELTNVEGLSPEMEHAFLVHARGLMDSLYLALRKSYEENTSDETIIRDFAEQEAEFFVDGRRYRD